MPEGQAAEIARQHYGVVAAAVQRLASEHDDTFKLTLRDGRLRFLRVSAADPVPAGVGLLTAILEHLAATAPDLPVQRIVRSADGAPEVVLTPGGRVAQMTTFLDGSLLRDVPSSAELRRDIGATLAVLSRALRRFTHPAAHRTHLWDLQNAPALRALLCQLPDAGPGAGGGPGMDAGLRGQLLAVLDRFEDAVRPALAGCATQVIHADFHGDNLLASAGNHAGEAARITGVLDFGDALIGPVAMDVAVAACYQLGAGSGDAGSGDAGSGGAGSGGAGSGDAGSGGAGCADLLGPALDVVAGYHAVDPLRHDDLPLIAEFIALRLATRIIVSQRNALREPGNSGYLLRKTPQAIEHFAAYRAIPVGNVIGRLRAATGMEH